jgi:hypothetical protein
MSSLLFGRIQAGSATMTHPSAHVGISTLSCVTPQGMKLLKLPSDSMDGSSHFSGLLTHGAYKFTCYLKSHLIQLFYCDLFYF